MRDTLRINRKNQMLEFEVRLMEHSIEDQKQRQKLLLENVATVRAQRHDLRHQLTVIRALNKDADNSGLSDYLDELMANIPLEPEDAYCENGAVNSIVSHYVALAERSGISVNIKLTVPKYAKNITDSTLCVIFGNLLENGIEACNRMTEGQKFIHLKSRMQYGMLTVVMDNSFDGKVNRDKGGLISKKREEHGIGTASITAVAEKHEGGARFEADGYVFLSSVYVKC